VCGALVLPVPSGKKFGGVKKSRRQGETPAASATPSKKIGGVKNVVPRGQYGITGNMESCRENCPGEWVQGMWIHSKECPWAVVIWKAHGKTLKDWHCPYDCDPTELPSGWTHPYTCPFWDETGTTPFDTPPPKANNAAESFAEFPKALEETGDDLPF
jgi:hypothetical protein